MTRAHFINIHMCAGASLTPGQGASDAVWLLHIRSEQRRHGARITPSRRVAPQWGVCVVVGFANGATISFTLRLASIPIAGQRIARIFMK